MSPLPDPAPSSSPLLAARACPLRDPRTARLFETAVVAFVSLAVAATLALAAFG